MILSVSLLQDPFRIDSVGFFTTEARHKRLQGRPTGGPEISFTEKQIFYDVGGSIFVAGWAKGFLGGRAEPSRVKGEESTRGFPKMRPDFDDRRSG